MYISILLTELGIVLTKDHVEQNFKISNVVFRAPYLIHAYIVKEN